jgi:hypothetical protein
MKKSPVNKRIKKKVVSVSNNAAEKKRSVKVYRKDGTLKSESTSRRGNSGFDKKNVYKGSTKKETRYTGSPRTLKTKAVEIDVKDPSTRSYTKYKKDGTVKKQIKSSSIPGQGGNTKKIARKSRRDAKGAQTVSAKDVKVKRSPAKMKSPAKKPLVGKQKSLPKELQQAILKSPGKMLSKSAIKMMDKSPMNMKTPMKKSKQKVEQDYARNAIADYKSGKTKAAKYEKKKALEVAAGESPAKMKNPSKKRAKLMDKVEKFDNLSNFRGRPGNLKPRKNEGSEKKYDKRMDRGFNKADKKMSKVMAIDSPAKMKNNQDGGGYAAKNPAAPARQLKKLGSILSKHMKSN